MIKNLIKKLKIRWGIESSWQVLIILIPFSLAGPTTLYFHRKLDLFLGIGDDSSFWLKLLVFVIVVLPLYNIFLFIYGVAIGQYKFFRVFFRDKLMLLKKLIGINK